MSRRNGTRLELPMLRYTLDGFVKSPPIPAGGPWLPYPPHPANSKTAKNEQPTSHCLYHDDQVVIISDAFPKSTCHCLVLPKDQALHTLNSLHSGHIPLLQHMFSVGCLYTEFLRSTQFPRLRFICGFHAIPSLPPLHMHCISMDLTSDRLKNKKHYNSFATNFFLPLPSVVEDIKRHGQVTINQNVAQLELMESSALKCLWCAAPQTSMPELKAHIAKCPRNRSHD